MSEKLSRQSRKPEFGQVLSEAEVSQLSFFKIIADYFKTFNESFVFSQSPGEYIGAKISLGDPNNHHLLIIEVERYIENSNIWLNFSFTLGQEKVCYRLDIDIALTPRLENAWLGGTMDSYNDEITHIITSLLNGIKQDKLISITDNFSETEMSSSRAVDLLTSLIADVD